MKIIAKTYQGLEELAAQEIAAIGGSQINILKRAVAYQGSRYTMYASNLFLRTPTRILIPILEVEIEDELDLYKTINQIAWEDYFDLNQTFAVYATTSSSSFKHSKYLALKSKDAIVDRYRRLLDKRPNVDRQNADFIVNIHVRDHILTVSLDASGHSLHLRGYAQDRVPAPLNENLAAALLLLSGWDRSVPLLDPMCGSGTILAEAHLWSHGLPPQRFKQDFSCKKWKDFSPEIYQKSWDSEKSKLPVTDPVIMGKDISFEAIKASQNNLKRIGAKVELEKENFFLSEKPYDKGIIIMNPPYDKRLQSQDIKDFYTRIGNTLKQKYTGWRACIFSGNEEAIKAVGLRPTRRISLMNGPLPAKFFIFDIYEGSKRHR